MNAGADLRPWYVRAVDAVREIVTGGKPGRVPGVIYEEHLEGVFQGLQRRFPNSVTVAPYLVGR